MASRHFFSQMVATIRAVRLMANRISEIQKYQNCQGRVGGVDANMSSPNFFSIVCGLSVTLMSQCNITRVAIVIFGFSVSFAFFSMAIPARWSPYCASFGAVTENLRILFSCGPRVISGVSNVIHEPSPSGVASIFVLYAGVPCAEKVGSAP